jgi:hypothetical protein
MNPLFALFMAGALGPASAPVPGVDATGLRKDGYVLLLSPGVLALEVRDPDFRMYAWGLSGGRLFTGAKRFATIFGGFFEHNLWVNRLDPERGDRAAALNFIRLGPELRLGGSSERVFGYGLARLGIDIVAARGAPGLASFMVTGGAGIMAALTRSRRLLLAFEPAIDYSVPYDLALFRARVLVGVRF